MPTGKRGRWRPTDEQLKRLETLAGIGMSEEDMAALCNVSVSTFQLAEKAKDGALRKCLESGRAKANSEVGGRAFRMAIDGKNPAMTIFWLKTRMRWKEPPQEIQPLGKDGKPITPSSDVKVIVTLPDNGRKDVE